METTEIIETEELKLEDQVVGRTREVRDHVESGYPYNLKEEEVEKLIYFFGARRMGSKVFGGGSSKTRDFTTDEKRMLDKIFVWFGFSATNPTERIAAYRAVCSRFKTI